MADSDACEAKQEQQLTLSAHSLPHLRSARLCPASTSSCACAVEYASAAALPPNRADAAAGSSTHFVHPNRLPAAAEPALLPLLLPLPAAARAAV